MDFYFPNGKIETKGKFKDGKELENGGIIMNLVGLNRYQATLYLVRGRENGLNMTKMGKNQELQFTSRTTLA